jgi:hypothetical protein
LKERKAVNSLFQPGEWVTLCLMNVVGGKFTGLSPLKTQKYFLKMLCEYISNITIAALFFLFILV